MARGNFITPGMNGRLGNNMFQIAHAVNQSILHQRELVIFSDQLSAANHKDNIFRNLVISNEKLDKSIFVRKGSTFHYTPVFPDAERPTLFSGHFQSEKYFYENKDYIKRLFQPPESITSEFLATYPQLLTSGNACISVRRGDYLRFSKVHPVLSLDYIYHAVSRLNADWHFVFSDDLDWCRENLKLENSVFVDMPDWKSLWLMTLCDSFVISASTFSWWGAYLSSRENKTTYAPDIWLTNGLNTDDLYHSEHTKIPCYVKDGVLYAKS